MTLMPNSIISSSPAWDPSLWTPVMTPDLDLAGPSIEVGQQLVMQHSHIIHPLLDP